MSIRVLIADDQEIIRAGLATILNGQPDIEVVAQAGDGHEAVRRAQQMRPDVCLFDIRMPHLDGIAATRALAGPDVEDPLAVVVITTFDTPEHISGALAAGARGFLLKDAGPALLVQAIHAAAEGDALIAPSVTVRLLSRFAESASPSIAPVQPVVPLTEREEDVTEAIAAGLTNAEIAGRLYISLSTVKFHVSSIMDKVGARSRVQVVIWAYETGRARRP
ncbi:MAG: response regulator transcription factor [Ornithinimicrobium sp.]